MCAKHKYVLYMVLNILYNKIQICIFKYKFVFWDTNF